MADILTADAAEGFFPVDPDWSRSWSSFDKDSLLLTAVSFCSAVVLSPWTAVASSPWPALDTDAVPSFFNAQIFLAALAAFLARLRQRPGLALVGGLRGLPGRGTQNLRALIHADILRTFLASGRSELVFEGVFPAVMRAPLSHVRVRLRRLCAHDWIARLRCCRWRRWHRADILRAPWAPIVSVLLFEGVFPAVILAFRLLFDVDVPRAAHDVFTDMRDADVRWTHLTTFTIILRLHLICPASLLAFILCRTVDYWRGAPWLWAVRRLDLLLDLA